MKKFIMALLPRFLCVLSLLRLVQERMVAMFVNMYKGVGLFMRQYTYWGLLALLSLLAVGIIVLSLVGPIPQDVRYHDFADQRTYFDIPNFFNVISNVPFLMIGCYATVWLLKNNKVCFHSQREIFPYLIYFVSVALVAIGSGYYHWNPNNSTLIFDRLPMTVAFMSFFSAIIAERISLKFGLASLMPFILLGIASIVYWHVTESHGHGDLRPYALVQFYPMLAIPMMLMIYPSRYTKQYYLWFALLLYLIAKLFEWQDKLIYQDLTYVVSGHTLKHLIAAMAAYCILLYLQQRRYDA